MLQTPSAKAVILDAEGLRRAWRRIAHEVIERQPNLARLSLLGIVTRGVPLAERLAATLEELEGVRRVEEFARRYVLAELAWPGGATPFLNVNTPAELSVAARRLEPARSRSRR